MTFAEGAAGGQEGWNKWRQHHTLKWLRVYLICYAFVGIAPCDGENLYSVGFSQFATVHS